MFMVGQGLRVVGLANLFSTTTGHPALARLTALALAPTLVLGGLSLGRTPRHTSRLALRRRARVALGGPGGHRGKRGRLSQTLLVGIRSHGTRISNFSGHLVYSKDNFGLASVEARQDHEAHKVRIARNGHQPQQRLERGRDELLRSCHRSEVFHSPTQDDSPASNDVCL